MTNKPANAPAEELDAHECWAFLRGVSVGRLAVWDTDHPDIFPINYAVDHGSLVFRTGLGTKLDAALGETPVAFEADGVDPVSAVAWSVVAKGSARRLDSTEDVLASFSIMLFPWQSGHKDTFIRIEPTSITGRKFVVADPAQWWTAQATATRTSPE
ncbi:pyridoxamine 5'-phosphate oxidase family protein [Arthrobacter glacialis]|uniref:Flavin-nucleotide-binding protein n=1 Tax=Arthrobacter glacialis TaxID=1664 RepID=A0A2S3ZTQ6_ARTGL|nr:pyridoxamine 5'-phosphate oxidase family protein [Arthrobacter glacialis]POH72600.1 flavin-nucleotide-binding protein [Arthrobacter glacialis]